MLLPCFVFAKCTPIGIIPTSTPAYREYHSSFGQRVESVHGVYNPSRLWCRCPTTWLFRVIDGKISRQKDGLRVSSPMKFQRQGCTLLCDPGWRVYSPCDKLTYCSVRLEAIAPRRGSKLRCPPWWYALWWRLMMIQVVALLKLATRAKLHMGHLIYDGWYFFLDSSLREV